MDVVFINPGNAAKIYQGLAGTFAAVEPPTWALLLAESVRSQNLEVTIIDANAEELTDEDVISRIASHNPKSVSYTHLTLPTKRIV